MSTITANVSTMFDSIDPSDVSASVAEHGECAGMLTWRNALAIAERYEAWLISPLSEACDGMREWARDMGAWDEEERNGWTAQECLALFVQNVASELRQHLASDDCDTLLDCADVYASTDWERESAFPTGVYYRTGSPDGDDTLTVDYYTGV